MAKEPDPMRHAAERQERRDLSFDEGVQEALRRIAELYEDAGRDLLVVINGSWLNVGKTRLEQAIRQELTKARIYTDTVTDDLKTTLDREGNIPPEQLEAMQYRPHKVHFRIIQGLTLRSTEQYREFQRRNPELAVPDLIIAIYRPDKPFYEKEGLVPVGDIVIRNEQAADKSS